MDDAVSTVQGWASFLTDNPIMMGLGVACRFIIGLIASLCNGVTAIAYVLQGKLAEAAVTVIAGRLGSVAMLAAKETARQVKRNAFRDVLTNGVTRASKHAAQRQQTSAIASGYSQQVSAHLAGTAIASSLQIFNPSYWSVSTAGGRGGNLFRAV